MSSFEQSNDDFFNNPLSGPPKQATRLSQTTTKPAASTANRMSKRTATTAKRAPPPPPNNGNGAASSVSTTSTTTAAASTASTTATARPRPTASSSSSAAANRRRPNRPAPSAQTLQPSTTNATAAAASNVNSFYGNASATANINSTTAAPAMGGTGFYNAAPAPSSQEWDSWGAPVAANTANNQWNHAEYAQASNDWYSSGAVNNNPIAPTFNQWQPQPMQGSMDNVQDMPMQQQQQQPSMFQPNAFFAKSTSSENIMQSQDDDDFENEAPLLEELGIHFDSIWLKTKTVCWPFSRTANLNQKGMVDAVVEDADLIGPICYCLALGGEMVLTGKLQFGYIYGFGLFGCVAMTLIVNLTAPKDSVSFWVVSSVLGYALIPVNILALVKIIVMNLASLQTLGRILGLITVLWSTTASTRLLEIGCGLREQRYLIAYPIALLYSAFVLITIF